MSEDQPGVPPHQAREQAHERYSLMRIHAWRSLVLPSVVAWGIWLYTCFTDHGFDPYLPWPLLITAGSAWHMRQVLRHREGIIEVQRQRVQRQHGRDGRSR